MNRAKITMAVAVKADRARGAALAFLAREKGGGSPVPLPASGPTLAKFAAEYVERCSSLWKPSTVKATLSHLDSAILPAFGHLRVGSVVCADIARFHEYGHRKPGGANRSHEILRTCSIAPSRGTIGRCRREPAQGHRPLLATAAGAATLGVVLRLREGENPVCVVAVHLLLLTGAGRGRYAACAGARPRTTGSP